MSKFNPKARLSLIVLGAPLALAVLWSAKDTVGLIRNYRTIAQVQRLIKQRQEQKNLLETELSLLEKGDPGAWKKVFRQELHALLPHETEYRFK